MKEYNIVVASDRNYIGFVSILFASILSNKKEDENVNFCICQSLESGILSVLF